ncbi:unnamed protein product [Brassica oleracea]|uniref:Uncharacterized protein n=3 Tax=Brassica TaxID=3705 RepID=A0A0D3AIP2_BRAOL|nr:unnamed protein product [Brassica napus]VDD18988.1 unnamed protein product [Brassica oleracea]
MTMTSMVLLSTYGVGTGRHILLRPRASPGTLNMIYTPKVENGALSQSKKILLKKLAVQAVIFQIWKQRNNLIHNNAYLPPSSVFRAIDREIRNIISSRRSTKQFTSLMVTWLV